MDEKIARAAELVRQAEARVQSAKNGVLDARYADGPQAYGERMNATTEMSRAETNLALMKAQLSEMERNAAAQTGTPMAIAPTFEVR